MAEGIQKYNHNQIIQWLEKKFPKKKGYKVYRDLEDIPKLRAEVEKEPELRIALRLPVDLICAQEEEESTEKGKGKEKFWHYTIFLVNSTQTISESLTKRLSFYEFCLTRITSIQPNRLMIVVAISHYFRVSAANKQFFEDNGFGLWKIDIDKNEKKKVVPAMNLRARMSEEFKKAVDEPDETVDELEEDVEEPNVTIDEPEEQKKSEGLKKTLPINKIAEEISINVNVLREPIKKRAKDFVLFFEEYIDDAVESIAGISPEQFGERYIDKKVMDKVLDLKNISYNKELGKVVTEHLTEKANEYEFTNEVFSELWKNQIGLPYSDFLKNFEPGLQYIFADTREKGRIYRDHYLHQFQVFLLGVSIIDNLYEIFEKKYKNPELSWLIASSFHDIAYPVQLYDDWCEKFFKDVFTIDKSPGTLELKSNFVDHSFLSCMGYIIDSLHRSHLDKKPKPKWFCEKNDLVQFFYNEITTRKNHGIMSSISLLKMIQTSKNKKKIKIKFKKEFQGVLQEIFMPGVLAITLHENEIWSGLKEGRNEDKLPVVLPCLKFENDPLSFLLIFCDSVQEWGRPSKSQEEEEVEKIKRFDLKEFECRPNLNEVKITINTPNHKDPYFSIDEFKDELAIKALCKAINKNRYEINFKEPDNTISWLNELLKIPKFYDIWHKKDKLIDKNEDAKKLVYMTKGYRDKSFSELDKLQQKDISNLNRLILEATHKKICPKNFFKEKKEELRRMQAFLQQPSNIKFVIRLEDKDEVGEDFEMKGPPS